VPVRTGLSVLAGVIGHWGFGPPVDVDPAAWRGMCPCWIPGSLMPVKSHVEEGFLSAILPPGMTIGILTGEEAQFANGPDIHGVELYYADLMAWLATARESGPTGSAWAITHAGGAMEGSVSPKSADASSLGISDAKSGRPVSEPELKKFLLEEWPANCQPPSQKAVHGRAEDHFRGRPVSRDRVRTTHKDHFGPQRKGPRGPRSGSD
jgi:hypothetical protein